MRKYNNCSVILVIEDHAIEAGNIASSAVPANNGHTSHNEGQRIPMSRMRVLGDQWLMNYREAAIYLEEGVNNEKFDTHPKNQSALPAYLIGKLVQHFNC